MSVEPDAAVFLPFENSYARLPERFYARLAPTQVRAPRLVRLNEDLARELGLDPAYLASPEGVEILAGNRVAGGSEPIAMAYAGHQFGGFVPQLGDGRAILLGEVIDRTGQRRDIQLKGSGPTPFSRRGDGRAALGPVLREYIIGEAMYALGIPTTRALAAVTTGEDVMREKALPGAVLTRVAASHIRVGTFQFFAVRRDEEGLRALTDYVIERHYPDLAGSENPAAALLMRVIDKQAELIARWMLVGFIHGVMNTDNMAISGETIDYGPCAFMDTFDPATVYSSIDEHGRYAYGNQPVIGQWNLTRLAEALLPVIAEDREKAVEIAQEAINAYPGKFEAAFIAGYRKKLGFFAAEEGDPALVKELMDLMAANNADFTLTFRGLSEAAGDPAADAKVRALFDDPAAADGWLAKWRERLAREGGDPAARSAAMRATNSAFIPRNHLVEEALNAAVNNGDLAPFEKLIGVLAHPFDDQADVPEYTLPPRPEQVVRATFCGT
ncbi:MAG: YdiU family protein [Hyphomicrobium sp.]|nr:YdiU family protein [Hyphomicrobium sp.]